MEDRYYSSDEEIAWGPLTLREIKKELLGESRKLSRRESDVPYCKFFTPSTTFSEENVVEVDSKTGTSLTSTYYTPNSSLPSEEEPSSKNDLFLERLTKVIEGENCNEVEFVKPENDTLLNILQSKEEDFDRLENIQQTLIDSTIQSCEDDEINSLIHEISSEDENEAIIVISDNSMSEIDSPNKSYITSVKLEEKSECCEQDNSIGGEHLNDNIITEANRDLCNNISTENEEDLYLTNEKKSSLNYKDTTTTTESDVLDFIYEEQEYPEGTRNKDREKMYQSVEKENTSREKECEVFEADLSREKECQVSESDSSSYLIEQHTSKISEISINKDSRDESEEKCDSAVGRTYTANEHDFKLNSLQYLTSDPSELESGSDSPVFNDTMEEMEMALQQGLDYVMPEDNLLHKYSRLKTPQKLEPQKPTGIRKLQKTPQNHDKFGYIRSPIGDYIKKKIPNDDNFKVPLKPVKHKVTPNFTRSPLIQTNQFKNIESPIGIYIKNSPGPCLKQNINAKTVLMLKSPMKAESVKASKENTFSIPEVVYKPAKKVVATSKTKNIVLPSSIQKMVKEPVITKHEARIQGDVNKSGISKKLLEENLTVIDSSVLNQSSDDISFVNVKQAFIK